MVSKNYLSNVGVFEKKSERDLNPSSNSEKKGNTTLYKVLRQRRIQFRVKWVRFSSNLSFTSSMNGMQTRLD